MKLKLKKILKKPKNINLIKTSKGSLAVFAIFLLALNFLVSQKSFYFDLTSDKIYTASDVSKNILGNLQKPVKVTFYMSKDLPSDYLVFKTQIQDLMNQYQDLAKGKLEVKYEEPDNETATIQKLGQKGIMQLQSEVVEKDKMEIKNFFFGAEISSGEDDGAKTEVLSAMTSLEGFEYDLISAVSSVSKDQKEMIALLKGHKEKDLSTDDLAKSYDIQKVSIASEGDSKGFYIYNGEEDKLPTSSAAKTETSNKELVNPATVIIAGPQTKLSEQEIAVLDDFVSKGGKVVVLAEKINPDFEQGFVSKKIENNVSDFTKKYGIEIEDNLLYDKSNLTITYAQPTYFGTQYMSANYPFWVKTLKENFSDHPALSKVQSLAFLWVSSLKIENVTGWEIKNLITSSNDSAVISENINISPENNLSFANSGEKIIAAVSSSTNGTGQVVVVGDSDFVSPSFMQAISDNEIFFTNLVDSISSSENLSSIRSKNISERPLKEIAESEKNNWKFFAILGGALILDIYGFVRISKRKKRSISL